MAKFVTAQEAVQYIHSGDRVALAHSVGEPQALVNAMLDPGDVVVRTEDILLP